MINLKDSINKIVSVKMCDTNVDMIIYDQVLTSVLWRLKTDLGNNNSKNNNYAQSNNEHMNSRAGIPWY